MYICIYSRTSIARTPLARLSWLIRTRIDSVRNSSDNTIKQTIKKIFLFYREIVCCVYSLESPHRCVASTLTWHCPNVAYTLGLIMSQRAHDVASTLRRCCNSHMTFIQRRFNVDTTSWNRRLGDVLMGTWRLYNVAATSWNVIMFI